MDAEKQVVLNEGNIFYYSQYIIVQASRSIFLCNIEMNETL